MPRRADAVAVPAGGFLAAAGFLTAAALVGAFFAGEIILGFLAGAFFLAGGVAGPAPQASAARAKAAAKAKTVRMSVF